MINNVNESLFVCLLDDCLDLAVAESDADQVVLVELEGHALELAHLRITAVFARERVDLLQDVGEVGSDLVELLGG